MPEKVGEFKGLEIMLLINRAYAKHQGIYDRVSFRKLGFLYSALQSPTTLLWSRPPILKSLVY